MNLSFGHKCILVIVCLAANLLTPHRIAVQAGMKTSEIEAYCREQSAQYELTPPLFPPVFEQTSNLESSAKADSLWIEIHKFFTSTLLSESHAQSPDIWSGFGNAIHIWADHSSIASNENIQAKIVELRRALSLPIMPSGDERSIQIMDKYIAVLEQMHSPSYALLQSTRSYRDSILNKEQNSKRFKKYRAFSQAFSDELTQYMRNQSGPAPITPFLVPGAQNLQQIIDVSAREATQASMNLIGREYQAFLGQYARFYQPQGATQLAQLPQGLGQTQSLVMPGGSSIDCSHLVAQPVRGNPTGSKSVTFPTLATLPSENHSVGFDDQNKNYAEEIYKQFLDESELAQTDESGVTSFLLNKPGLRHTRVKVLGSKTYDGPKKQDFLDRVDVVGGTAKKFLQDKRVSDPRGLIDQTIAKYAKLIKNTEFDWEQVQLEMDSGGKVKYFKKRRAAMMKHLKSFVSELVDRVNDLGKSKKVKISKNELRKEENRYNSFIGRPNLFSVYDLDPVQAGLTSLRGKHSSAHVTPKKFISSHRPFDKTSDSSVQTSAVRDSEGLANALESSFFEVQADKTVRPLFSAYRHSSYSPIGIWSRWKRDGKAPERLSIAMKNMEAMLTHLVNNYKVAHPDDPCPKEVPLSSMILLTPGIAPWELFRAGESEARQIEESYLITRMIDGKKLDIAGCVGVTPRISLMNLGANKYATGIKGALMQATEMKNRINAKGYSDFDSSMKTFLIPNFKVLHKNLSLVGDSSIDRMVKGLKSESEKLKKLYETKSPEMEKLEASIQNQQAKIQREIPDFDPEDPQDFYKKYEQFKKMDTELLKSYEKLEVLQRKQYAKNQDQIRRLENGLISKLNDLKQSLSMRGVQSPDAEPLLNLLEKQSDVLRAYSDAKKVYYRKDFKTSQYRLDFQKYFLYANYRIGANVEFFCKSAEDRTGRLNNKIEEMLAFKAFYGRLPIYDSKSDQEKIKIISERVYHGGSSRDTTGMNVRGARGLQVDSGDLDYGKKAGIENSMGKLAKEIY